MASGGLRPRPSTTVGRLSYVEGRGPPYAPCVESADPRQLRRRRGGITGLAAAHRLIELGELGRERGDPLTVDCSNRAIVSGSMSDGAGREY